MQNFSTIDLCIFIAYILEIAIVGIFIGRNKKNQNRDTTSDYFLASNKLTWWAVGASLIAANISAEQIIGMSGSGFKIGLGIASYEWMAAITLILVAKFIMPIFLKKGIYTMPQFLEQRYDKRVRTVMAVFWLLVYVFVNLTSILYLGALALENIMGIPMMWGIVGLAVFAAAYSIRGGLKSVAWTDILQVILLIGGGLVTTYVALNMVSGGNGPFQ
ncbi:MAG: sodium/glucose cotransporter, partial [Bacteroidales bacterium]|nr:sodium/glucose cotransporter [Bacteroidales bacterium]